jgi:hypothetical protein
MTQSSLRTRISIPVFAATLSLSAFLLFLVQPMVGKIVLPAFGGSTSVWTVCQLFFQMVLLLAYLYAHLMTRYSPTVYLKVHAVLLLLTLFALPISVDTGIAALENFAPPVVLLSLLITSIALPFFVVSTSAPLLQRWFSSTGHAASHDPYFLYAVSNFGSVLGLLAYPLLIEPLIPLAYQEYLWSIGYVLLLLGTLGCHFLAHGIGIQKDTRQCASSGSTERGDEASSARPTPGERLRWVVLAFVPSSLMLGVTNYVTTDVSPIPMLWVIPLGLYLVSFIVAFGRPPRMLTSGVTRAFPIAVLLLLFTLISPLEASFWKFWMSIALHFTGFFIAALACHITLAARRPPVRSLTEFYLFISLGGALGGVFNALIAPLVFNSLAEYPITIFMAALVVPGSIKLAKQKGRVWANVALPIFSGAIASLLVTNSVSITIAPEWIGDLIRNGNQSISDMQQRLLRIGFGSLDLFIQIGIPAFICYLFAAHRVRFGLSIGTLLLVSYGIQLSQEDLLFRDRSFYGVIQVAQLGEVHQLFHGTTVHGIQNLQPEMRQEPLTYYHRGSPIGEVLERLGRPMEVAVVGLGAGTLASYADDGQRYAFYEIDPMIARVANDPELFTYLDDARDRGAEIEIVLGDARVTLTDAPDAYLDLLVIDAFSSDAIPVHLFTREAIELYARKLNANGVLAFHISNQYVDLRPVLANIGADLGMIGAYLNDTGLEDSTTYRSDWVLLAPTLENLRSAMHEQTAWRPLEANSKTGVWTDDFSNVVSIVNWK